MSKKLVFVFFRWFAPRIEIMRGFGYFVFEYFLYDTFTSMGATSVTFVRAVFLASIFLWYNKINMFNNGKTAQKID